MIRGATSLLFLLAAVLGAAATIPREWQPLYLKLCLVTAATTALLWSVLVFVERPPARLLQILLLLNLTTFALEFGAMLGGPRQWVAPSQAPTTAACTFALGSMFSIGCVLLYLYARWGKTSKPSPQFGPAPVHLQGILRQTVVLAGCSLPLAVPLIGVTILQHAELTGLALAFFLTHQLMTLGLMINCTMISAEDWRFGWRSVGFCLTKNPAGSLLILSAAIAVSFYTHDPLWLIVTLLFARIAPPKVQVPMGLSPAQATLLLRLPLNVTTQCLQLIPPSRWSAWFRSDRQRLHLREPLLEVQNAPRYFKALAKKLSEVYDIHPDDLSSQEELADFCLAHPVSVSQVVLENPQLPEVDDLTHWRTTDLNQVRPASKLTTIQNLYWLAKVANQVNKQA